jgi:hypothetical protein
MKQLFALALLLIALAAFAPLARATEGCKNKVLIETTQQVCYTFGWNMYGVKHVSVFACGHPPTNVDPFDTIASTIVPAATGDICAAVTATYYPSAIMLGHTTAFQDFWNALIHAPPGTGSTGPAASYTTSMDGYMFCANHSYSTQETSSEGVPYTLQHWWATLSGSYCTASVYVYGTDGE